MKIFFRQNLPWFLFSCGLFILTTVLILVQKKMDSDGTLYASVAWNMAHNIGSLWHPVNTPSVFPQFYEHPSFGMFINSLFFRIFGDNFIVDRLYCLFTLILSVWATTLIWYQSQTVASKYLWWLLLFCWSAVPLMGNCYGANVIEDLLVVFTTFSVWAILRILFHTSKIGVLSLLFASACMTGAFFSNGLQAFFPFAVPIIYQVVFCDRKWKVILTQTFLLILFTTAIIFSVFLYHPAFAFIRQYFFEQIVATFTHARIGNGNYKGFAHLTGMWFVLHNLLWLFLAIMVVFIILAKKSAKTFLNIAKENIVNRKVILFLLIGLSASLPILASSRQMPHYFLQAFPFYILMFLEILTPMLKDVDAISKIVPKNAAISVNSALFRNWNLHAYLYRYYQIDLTQNQGKPFYLQYKNDQHLLPGYQKVDVHLQKYILYKKSRSF